MENNKDLSAEQQLGLKVEAELQKIFDLGKSIVTLEDIEENAPQTYDVLYDCCSDEDETNGIETSKFRLIEVTKEGSDDIIFKISKK